MIKYISNLFFNLAKNRLAFLPSCLLALFLILPAKADIMPYYVSSINPNSIGVYQASKSIKIYSEPNENSKLLLTVNWDSSSFDSPNVSASNLFVIFLQKKELAFLTVIDENDNGNWVKVSYNQNCLKTGWVKKDDEYRFMSWRSFFNLYGRKYGLYYLKDAPDEAKIIYSNNVEGSQEIGKVMMARSLKLTSVSGNWILVIGYDIDRTQKIGWIKWRNLSGEIFLFPDIK